MQASFIPRNRPEPPKARETDPNADPDSSLSERGKPRLLNKPAIDLKLFSVFFNGIDPKRTFSSLARASSVGATVKPSALWGIHTVRVAGLVVRQAWPPSKPYPDRGAPVTL